MDFDYQKAFQQFNENDIFDTAIIFIDVTDTNLDGEAKYVINNVRTKQCDDSGRLKKVIHKIDQVIHHFKVKESYTDTHNSWSIFYTLKELVDQITACLPLDCKPFYRGQSGDWELRPTLYRKKYQDEIRQNYDEIYQDIARRFPDDVQYRKFDDRENRASDLAELQHYGLPTPLMDMTENPFIALLFMTNSYQQDSGSEPQLDILLKLRKMSSLFKKRNGSDKING